MRRRKFLSATATLTMGAAISSDAASGAMPEPASSMDEAAQLADHLLDAFPVRPSLAAIGEAYWRGDIVDPLASRPSLPELLNHLLDHIQLSGAELRLMGPDAMRRRLKTQNIEDFSQHRTVLVEGWLLGETETRLCALAARRSV